MKEMNMIFLLCKLMRVSDLVLWLAIAMIVIVSATTAAGTHQLPLAKPHCPSQCGGVVIPYPFGLTKNCSLDDSFLISCKKTSGRTATPIIDITDQVEQISISDGYIRISPVTVVDCYDKFGRQDNDDYVVSSDLDTSPYSTISANNLFIGIGCDTIATIDGIRGGQHDTTGCISVCSSLDSTRDGCCDGIGCCQIQIPEGSTYISYSVKSLKNHSKVWDFNRCGYAFIVGGNKFNFSRKYLANYSDEGTPMVLAWAIKNETCESAKNKDTYACKAKNSECKNIENGLGYRCGCRVGYAGNPYLPEGCQDVDECKENLHDCEYSCKNTIGCYEFSCPKGYYGDGKKGGEDCILLTENNRFLIIKIAVACGVSFIAAIMDSSWIYFALKKRKLIRIKEEFFRKNGGFILQQRLSAQEHSASITIFSSTELEKATNNFDEQRVIGKGGCGTIFKGFLTDKRVVAIKKSTIMSETQIESFINELVVLSQVNHRNIVKLSGCCLEMQVPLLVYEYVSNGTLYSYIHNEGKKSAFSWEHRLRVAMETASALSYLHFAASTPIIHRDVKSTNILLDEKYTVKVSYFGLSKLVPSDVIQLATIVQGTLGYIDPEYVRTSPLTEKNDVYSFGVVLAELLTGKKAISFDRPEAERTVAALFLLYMENDRLSEVFDDYRLDEGNAQQIKEVAELARKCLSIKGDERPTMKEVAIELELIVKKNEKHSQVIVDGIEEENAEHRLSETVNYPFSLVDDDNSSSTYYDSKFSMWYHLLLNR